MKKIFFLITICSLLTQISDAQLPQPNSNYLNSNIDRFVGTWVWVSGVDTVKIILKKENIPLPFPENSRTDVLIGYHMYKRGNVIIESTLKHSTGLYADRQYSIFGGGDRDSANLLNGSLKDIGKNKLVDLFLRINNAQNQLKWETKNRPGLKLGPYDWSFTLPQSITLRRQ